MGENGLYMEGPVHHQGGCWEGQIPIEIQGWQSAEKVVQWSTTKRIFPNCNWSARGSTLGLELRRRNYPRTRALERGELSPWGGSFCPRTKVPGGENVLSAEGPPKLLSGGRPCPVTPGLILSKATRQASNNHLHRVQCSSFPPEGVTGTSGYRF